MKRSAAAVTASPLRALCALLLLGFSPLGHTQSTKPVYRCANGSYSDQACANGAPLAVDDARTPAQQAQARDAAAREAALAVRLAAERRAQEAAAQRRPAPMAGIGQKPAAAPAAHAAASASKKQPHRKTAQQRAQDDAAKQAKQAKKTGAKPAAAPDGRMGQY